MASAPVESQKHVIEVRAFGALGDGVHDDLAAIGRAIDAVATGDVLHVPAGTYLLSDTIRVARPHVSLSGDGAGSVLRATDPSHPLFSVSADDFSLQGLALQGSAVDESKHQWGVFTVEGAPATGGTVRGCSFSGFSSGIKLDTGSSRWIIEDSSFKGLVGTGGDVGYGILVGAATGTVIHRNRFQGSSGHGRHAIYLSGGASDSQATDNQIDHFNSSSISIYAFARQPACSGNLVARNTITGQAHGPDGSAAIEMSGFVVDTKVEGNVIEAPEGVGIIVADAAQGGHNQGAIIEGNQILRAGDTGILLRGAIGAHLANNHIVDANSSGATGVFGGIEVNDASPPPVASRDVVVEGNTVEHSGAARYRAAIVVRSDASGVHVGQNQTMAGVSER